MPHRRSLETNQAQPMQSQRSRRRSLCWLERVASRHHSLHRKSQPSKKSGELQPSKGNGEWQPSHESWAHGLISTS